MKGFTAFTDGSRTDDGVGAGFAIYHGKQTELRDKVCLPDTATVFQAEIVAIKEATQAILGFAEEYKYVKFYVGSQGALSALES